MESAGEVQAAGAGAVRASNAERDVVAGKLQDAFADGRLDDDEFDQRMRQALTAKTHAELDVLLTDLPAASGAPRPGPDRAGQDGAGQDGAGQDGAGQSRAVQPGRLAVADAVRAEVTGRGLPGPNIDFALAVLSRVAGMTDGAGEAIFAVARTAGWTAHAMEEYARATPLRPRAVYVGPAPRDAGAQGS